MAFPRLADGVTWFVVLPDSDGCTTFARSLAGYATDQINHPSGRAWIVGRWDGREILIASAGAAKIVLLGHHDVAAPRLEDLVGQVQSVSDIDRVAAALNGSFHLLASVRGMVRAQGTVLGLRRLFAARSSGLTIAADRADVLAAMIDSAVDVPRLALHLLFPAALHPVTDHPVWQGVDEVPSDHYLSLDHSGRARTFRRWAPPEGTLGMSEGAQALQQALWAAVGARLESGAPITCDLAGIDSTAICSIAARQGASVTAFTAQSPDPVDDDLLWARRTLADLPGVGHEVIPARELPLFYDDLLNVEDVLDEPCSTEPDRPRFVAMTERIVLRGSRVHLNGFGGDELLHGAFAHLHRMMRVHPRSAVNRIRGFRVKYGWPLRDLLRLLLENQSYKDWLASAADTLTAASPPMSVPMLDWSWAPRFAPWVSPAAVEMARGLIKAGSADAEPLGTDKGQHFDVQAMRAGARHARQYDQIARRIGVPIASPFYDDKVVEAGLAVLPRERLTPWRYKPLIMEAMRTIVPEASLRRTTKPEWSVAHQMGLCRHRDQLLALTEESRLADLGLIDIDKLRGFCRQPVPKGHHPGVFDPTAGCEKWLRSLETSLVQALRGRNADQPTTQRRSN